MPPIRVLRFEWHLLETGVWCDRCLLPSVYRLALVQLPCLHIAGRFRRCDDCGHVEQER